MDEAKSLTHMALAAMISAVLLSMVFSLILLGQSMWKAMDQEDTANSRIKTYANYSAYDNKIVRAQDIIQLVEEHYDDIWVLVCDGPVAAGNPMKADGSLWNMPAYTAMPNISAYMYNPNKYTGNYTLSSKNYLYNVVPVLDSALSQITSNNTTVAQLCDGAAGDTQFYVREPNGVNPSVADVSSKGNMYGIASTGQYDCLQSLFLNNNNLNRLSRADANTSYTFGTGYYAPFLSVLVYDSDNTTDVVGVIFVRETSEVNPESVDDGN